MPRPIPDRATAAVSPVHACLLLSGTMAALWSARLWPAPLALAALGVSLPMLWVRVRWLRWPAICLLGAAWAMLQAAAVLGAQLPPGWEGREAVLRGRVVELPSVEARRTRFLLRVDGDVRQPAPLRGRLVQVSWYDEFGAQRIGPRAAVRAGARWELRLRLRAPRGLRNPGGFDAERQAVAQRIAARGVVRLPGPARQLRPPSGLVDWRARMAERIGAAAGEQGGRYVRALALGDTRGLSDEDWRLLRAVGLTHLIAISGFHVGLVALAAAWATHALWRCAAPLAARLPRRHAMALAGLGAAAGYACLAGLSLPTVRTVLMIGVVALARLRRRRVEAGQSLGLALIAVLALDPLSALLPGFWLSFGGVAWLVFGMPQARLGPIVGFLRAQWVATLGLLPLSVLLFAQASWVGPLANLVAIPWWTLVVVPLSLAGLGAEALHPGAGGPLWLAAAGCFDATWPWFQRLGRQDYALAWLPEASVLSTVLALAGAAWWLLPRGVPGKALASLLWLPLFWPQGRRPAPGQVELVAFDVGQGLAVLVRTRHHALLYDAGPRVAEGFDAGERVVVPGLHALGVARLDRLVVSHADDDHAGGVPAVRASIPVGALLMPPDAPLPLPARACERGAQWNWDGVRFRFLHPPPGFPYLGNESSCVLRIEAGGRAALLTGDIGRVIEQRLLHLAPADLRAEVVFAPHHGSAGSSSLGLVRASQARLVVYSSGHGNRFGHPRAEVVQRWAREGAEGLDTAGSGALRIWLGPQGLGLREQRRWQPRWWDAAERQRAAAILPGSRQSADAPGG